MRQVHLACGCHSQLLQVLPAQAANVSLVCFNLGYLPSGEDAWVARMHLFFYHLLGKTREEWQESNKQ